MNDISILIAGDYSPKERFQNAIDDGTYIGIFPGIRDIVTSVDYSVINFETTVPTVESTPIDKIGSHLSCKENAFDVLQFLGFNLLTIANNHFMDYGKSAMENSIRLASERGLEIVGGGKNMMEACVAKDVELKGKHISFINACEHEFSIATEKSAGCNPFDIIELSYQIKYSKKRSDYVILVLHGGNEHYQLPSPRMKKQFRFLIDQGADAIVNHHQHCYSGYEIHNGKPIFYGLGNFCFDSAADIKYRHKTYNYGYMVKLILGEKISFELFPYEQCYKTPGVFLFDEIRKIEFREDISKLNAIIADDVQLEELFSLMARKKRDFIYRGFRPFSNRIANALYYKGLLPSFVSKNRLKTILAILECEAHRDVLLANLRRC